MLAKVGDAVEVEYVARGPFGPGYLVYHCTGVVQALRTLNHIRPGALEVEVLPTCYLSTPDPAAHGLTRVYQPIWLPETCIVTLVSLDTLKLQTVSAPERQECSHTWAQYVGLTDQFAYCSKCDVKKKEGTPI